MSRFSRPTFSTKRRALVIWQVGTNAIYHDYNRRGSRGRSIEVGLQWLAVSSADVVLMDLQYTQAIVEKLKAWIRRTWCR